MPTTIELPNSLNEEVTYDAEREGVSPTEHATLLLYLATALLKDENPTPFQEAVKSFLTQRSIDAEQITSAFEALVALCLKSHPESLTHAITHHNLDLLKQWRNAQVHGTPSMPATQAKPEIDAERISRIKNIRGKFAYSDNTSMTDLLHLERQSDKEKDELYSNGLKS